MIFANKNNLKNIQFIIHFFSREKENGYVFAYSKSAALIPKINKEITHHFSENGEKIAVLFLDTDSNSTIIETIQEKLKEDNYKAIIIANLHQYIEKGGKEKIMEVNFAREQFYSFGIPILFWIDEERVSILSNYATDLYSQRKLSCFEFEKEATETAKTTYNTPINTHSEVDATQLLLKKNQFLKAKKEGLNEKRVVADYLLPYLELLSKTSNSEAEVLSLMEEAKPFIDIKNHKITIRLAFLFSDLHKYELAIKYATLSIDTLETKKDSKYDLATAYQQRANNLTLIWELLIALADYEKMQVLFTNLVKTNPNNEDYKNGLAISYSKLGETYTAIGNLDKALKYFEEDLKLTKELYKTNPNNVKFKNGLAVSYSKLGETYTILGNLEKALNYFEKGTELFEQLYKSNQNSTHFKNGLAISYEKLGKTYLSHGNLDKALKYFEDETELFEQQYKINPNNVSFKNGLAISYEKLGDTYIVLGDLHKALKYFEDSYQLRAELDKTNPNNVHFKKGLAVSYSKLGDLHLSLGNLDKAQRYIKDYNRVIEKLSKTNPNNVDFKHGLAISYSRLGEIHSDLGEQDKALKHYENYKRLRDELYKTNPNNINYKKGLAISYYKLGTFLIDKKNQITKGLDYLNKAKDLFEELKNKHPLHKEFEKNYKNTIKIIKSIQK